MANVLPVVSEEQEVIKELFLSLVAGLEQWATDCFGSYPSVDTISRLVANARMPDVPENRSILETFGVEGPGPHYSAFLSFISEFGIGNSSIDNKLLVYHYVFKLLERHFFTRYLPLGFTESEEAMIQEVRKSLLDGDSQKGDREFCEWRQTLIRAVFTASDTARADLEKQHLDERIQAITADVCSQLNGVGLDCRHKLIELVIRPAYALHRGMNTICTPFYIAWPRSRYRQWLSVQAVSRVTLRDIHSSSVRPDLAYYIVHDLYPALTMYETGSSDFEMVVPPVILVRQGYASTG